MKYPVIRSGISGEGISFLWGTVFQTVSCIGGTYIIYHREKVSTIRILYKVYEIRIHFLCKCSIICRIPDCTIY